MKIYKGKMDLWFHVCALSLIITSVVAIIMSLNDETMLFLVISVFALADTLFLSVYVKYKYVMYDTYFIGYFSFVNSKVPYNNIKSIKIIEEKSFNNCASKTKLKITCIVKQSERILYISPLEMEAFIEELLQKNPLIINECANK